MKLNTTTKASGEKEGARKIDRGRMGYLANLYSQTTKAVKRMMLRISNTIS